MKNSTVIDEVYSIQMPDIVIGTFFKFDYYLLEWVN